MKMKVSIATICFFTVLSFLLYPNEAQRTLVFPLKLRGNTDNIREWIEQSVQNDLAPEHNRRLLSFVTKTNEDIFSDPDRGTGPFLVEITFGSKLKKVIVGINNAISLTWVQCPQLAGSTSMHNVTCADPMCSKIYARACVSKSSTPASKCIYSAIYSDGRFTRGPVVKEDLIFGGDKVSQIYMGCAEVASFFGGYDGMIGLGRGPTNIAMKLGGTFSYNFPRFTIGAPNGTLCLGTRCPVPKNSITTKILPDPVTPSKYVVGLTSFSIAGDSVSLSNMTTEIDTGIFISRLSRPLYNAVRDTFLANVADSVVKLPPSTGLLESCFALDITKVEEGMFPRVALKFGSDGEVVLPTFAMITPNGENVTCLALQVGGAINVLGSYQQQGLVVGYNLRSLSVSFAAV